MKKIFKKSWLISIILLLCLLCYTISNLLVWPENMIRARLIADIPIGTSMEEVESYVKKKKWKIRYFSEKSGFIDQRKNYNPEQYSCRTGGNGKLKHNMFGYDDCIVGDKNMRTELGEYGIIFITSVTVFWGFNEKYELVDILVEKTVDAL